MNYEREFLKMYWTERRDQSLRRIARAERAIFWSTVGMWGCGLVFSGLIAYVIYRYF